MECEYAGKVSPKAGGLGCVVCGELWFGVVFVEKRGVCVLSCVECCVVFGC